VIFEEACGLGLPNCHWQTNVLAILLPSFALSCNVIFEGLWPRFAKVPLANQPFAKPILWQTN